jgi:hypothetical protein
MGSELPEPGSQASGIQLLAFCTRLSDSIGHIPDRH